MACACRRSGWRRPAKYRRHQLRARKLSARLRSAWRMVVVCQDPVHPRSFSLLRNAASWRPGPGNIRCRIAMSSGPAWCCWQLVACATTRSPNASTPAAKSSAIGANASSSNGWTASKSASGPAVAAFFPPELVMAVKPSPANCPPRWVCRCRASRCPTSRPRSSAGAWWPASPAPPAGSGWPRTPYDRGGTVRNRTFWLEHLVQAGRLQAGYL